jgi:hypothetical protein
MIKCVQCGKEMSLIQWTHFSKCIGPATTLFEYKQMYKDAPLMSDRLKQLKAITYENMVKKYGEELGLEKWNSYREKQAYSNSYEYKSIKHGWTKEQFDDFNASRAQTLELMIQRHGEIDGPILWKKYCDRQAYTNTLEYFIEEYGEHDGILKYYECSDGKAKSLKWCINKCDGDEERGELLFYEYKERTYNSSPVPYSKISIELFDNLDEYVINLIGDVSYYATKNSEFCKYDLLNKRVYFYDYVIPILNLVIEFNGDYYHCNPRKYTQTDHVNMLGKMIPVNTIWEKDRVKNDFMKSLGFTVIVVWEFDYRSNKQQVIDNLKSIIYDAYTNHIGFHC